MNFYPLGIALVLSIFLLPRIAHAQSESKPFNFVVILADDMSMEDCGAFGHPSIKTPNIDSLARAGMRFEHAVLTASSCSPSRASIMTARYPHCTRAAELHQPLPGDSITFPGELRKAGYYTASVGKWHLGNQVKKQFSRVREQTDASGSKNWVEELEKRPRDKPFFFWLAAIDPHRPYPQGTPESAPKVHDRNDVQVPPYLPDIPEIRDDLADYYDEIARLDDNVGKVVEFLRKDGVLDDTVVLFLSDNGRPFPHSKTRVSDNGILTPLIVRSPGMKHRGAVTRSLVSAVDIGPTILDLAGVPIPKAMQGKSFAAILEDPSVKVRDYAYMEHNWHDYKSHERGVRDERYTYIWNHLPDLPGTPPADAVVSPTYQAMLRLHEEGKLTREQAEPITAPRPSEFLFDNKEDPYSLVNLAESERYRKIRDRLRAALKRWQDQTDDFIPDPLTPDLFDRKTGKRLPCP